MTSVDGFKAVMIVVNPDSTPVPIHSNYTKKLAAPFPMAHCVTHHYPLLVILPVWGYVCYC